MPLCLNLGGTGKLNCLFQSFQRHLCFKDFFFSLFKLKAYTPRPFRLGLDFQKVPVPFSFIVIQDFKQPSLFPVDFTEPGLCLLKRSAYLLHLTTDPCVGLKKVLFKDS